MTELTKNSKVIRRDMPKDKLEAVFLLKVAIMENGTLMVQILPKILTTSENSLFFKKKSISVQLNQSCPSILELKNSFYFFFNFSKITIKRLHFA